MIDIERWEDLKNQLDKEQSKIGKTFAQFPDNIKSAGNYNIMYVKNIFIGSNLHLSTPINTFEEFVTENEEADEIQIIYEVSLINMMNTTSTKAFSFNESIYVDKGSFRYNDTEVDSRIFEAVKNSTVGSFNRLAIDLKTDLEKAIIL